MPLEVHVHVKVKVQVNVNDSIPLHVAAWTLSCGALY
jgi:hypothetical protein